MCGVANQRGRLCGRIGTCPFHSGQKKGATPKRPRSNAPAPASAPNGESGPAAAPVPDSKRLKGVANIRQMSMPPQKSRFKRSWTPDEHRLFLQAMRRHGKGKWKEIAAEVKTRTANQCQSHAQKYFLRQAKTDKERKKKSIHDVTEKDILETSWNNLTTAASTAQREAVPTAQSIVIHTGRGVPLAPRSSAPVQIVSSANVKEEPSQASGITTVNAAAAGASAAFLTNAASSTTSIMTSTQTPMPTPVTTAGYPLMHQTGHGMSTVPVVLPMSSLGIQYASMVPQFLNPGMPHPSSAAVVAPPPPQKLRVTVHINGKAKGGMALVLPNTFKEFFSMAKQKLTFANEFRRVFTRSGGEITCLDEMCQDDTLWLSKGEDFLTPR